MSGDKCSVGCLDAMFSSNGYPVGITDCNSRKIWGDIDDCWRRNVCDSMGGASSQWNGST